MIFTIAKPTFKTIAEAYAKKPIGLMYPHHVDKIANGCCVMCDNVIGNFRDFISMKEYGISGLCQDCQDGVFK